MLTSGMIALYFTYQQQYYFFHFMRIFETEGDWTQKVNFVDENNVVLGYSLAQNCCEKAGWFINNKPQRDILADSQASDFNLTDYRFDTTFYDEFNLSSYDDRNVAVFRIVNINDDTDEKFIHIYNEHNGYYSHGFDFQRGSDMIKTGAL
jgi:hypothetical protein